MRHIRKRLTYANVMSSIAVFLVMGGAAYAASQLPKNSVGTKQLKRNAVNGSKVKNGSLTGADLKLSTLGKVPSAANADNANNANTVGGQAAIKLFKTLTEGQSNVPVATVGGFSITATCNTNDANVEIKAPVGPGTVMQSGGERRTENTTTYDYSSTKPGEGGGAIQVDELSKGGENFAYGIATVALATSTGTTVSGVIGYDYDTFNNEPPNTCIVYGHLLAG